MAKEIPDDEFDFEGEPPIGGDADESESTGDNLRGEVVTKNRLSKLFTLAPMTIDRYIKEGAPVISRGTKKHAWEINTGEFFKWCVRRAVALATGDEDSMSLESARRRDKEAQARLREIEIEKKQRELIPIDDVLEVLKRESTMVRSRILAIPTQVVGLSEEQRDQLKAACNDVLEAVHSDRTDTWTQGPFDEPATDR